jgi:uncharacterized membrane protein YraQ (UPF0718 family)
MSLYLLFGFLFAGILHVFIKKETIGKHLGKNNFFSVIKSALFGIPLPLCSCAVIPAALSLRKEGASRGAVLSFLISTPTTGVDSILVAYALLGGIFALYRVGAAFAAAIFVGIMANLLIKDKNIFQVKNKEGCKLCCAHEEHSHSIKDKIKEVFNYAFGVLLKDTGKWILLGIIVGGIISYFLPENFIQTYLGKGWLSMIVMVGVGIPMYICASGSIPIAAALMLRGLSPGAAFAFLLAGPATNAVTVTVISKHIGKKAVIIYLGVIILSSIGLGMLLNKIWIIFNIGTVIAVAPHQMSSLGISKIIAGVILIICIGYHLVGDLFQYRKVYPYGHK